MADKILFSIEIDNTGAIKKIEQTRKAIGDDLPKSADKAATGMSKLQNSLKMVGVAFGVLAAVGVTKLARELVGMAGAVVQTGAKFEILGVQLKSVMGSSAGAQQALSWIKEFTLSTPYQLEQVTGAFVKLKAFGLNPMSGALQAVADATSYLGGSAETMNTLVLALGKSFTVGKMSMEEMRMMMERGIPVIDILSNKLGVSAGEILEMSRAGKIGRDEIGLLIDEMREMYSGASNALMDTFTGKWSNLQDQIDKTLDAMANTGALEIAKSGLDILITALEDVGDLFEDLRDSVDLTELIDALDEMGRAVGDLSDAITSSRDTIGILMQLFTMKVTGDIKVASGFLRSVAAGMESVKRHGFGPQGAVAAILTMGVAAKNTAKYVEWDTVVTAVLAERTEELNIQANRNLDTAKLLSKSLAERRDKIAELNTALADQSETLDDLEYKWKLEGYEADRATELMKAGLDDALASMQVLINNMDLVQFPPAPVIVAPVKEAFGIIGNSFSDLISKGFTGELDSFADIWENMWADMAKSMTTILGTAFEEGFKTDGNIFEKFKGGFDAMIESAKDNKFGSMVSGAGAVYSGYQQGGTGGIITGAMGGAMAGAPFGPWGIVIGAIVGAAAAYFGGGDDPSASGSISTSGGGLDSVHGQEGSVAVRNLWTQQRVSEYRKSIRMMNDVLRLFGDGDLFDLIKDAPEWNFTGGSLDSLAQVFRERWLPSAMRDMFKQAINTGLKSFGVDDETRRQLWSEIMDLSGSEQISGLETYISSLVNAVNLLDEMDWNAILDETRQDSMSRFLGGMSDNLEAVRTQMLGLDSMTLLERAEQATTVEQLIVSARQAEIQMLMQIDQLQKSINDSIDAQIEGIRVGGMSTDEQQGYYLQQIQDIMAQLRAGVSSPEALQALMADLQRYTGAYQSSLGDDLYTQSGFGGSQADWIIGILEEARGLSNEAFEDMRDAIREANDLLIAELSRLIEALTHYGDTVATTTANMATPQELSVTGAVNVNVSTSDQFWADVDARWEYNWMRRQQFDAGIN